MEIFGKPSINPFFFYTGKSGGYLTWLILALALAGIKLPGSHSWFINILVGVFLLLAGLMVILLSLINLGSSVSIGLPKGDTKLKSSGLYAISRNPMYIGMGLVTIASMVYTLNSFVFLAGIYSIIVYHFIIIGEEKFLKERFGKDYDHYMSKVDRYL